MGFSRCDCPGEKAESVDSVHIWLRKEQQNRLESQKALCKLYNDEKVDLISELVPPIIAQVTMCNNWSSFSSDFNQ